MNIIVLATHNAHKADELRRMFPGYQILTATDVGFHEDPLETGQSFTANALIKAGALLQHLQNRNRHNYIIVADDSGLCIDALDGAPGIHSARFCGKDSSDADRREAILTAMTGAEDRSAHYECAIVALIPGSDQPIVCRGIAEGEITTAERGENGFAFDSIFLSHDLGITFAEATEEEKGSVSHRGRAIQKLIEQLAEAGFGARDDEKVAVNC